MRPLSLLVALAVAVPLLAADSGPASSGKVAGSIIDAATGDPIPGATVVIEGTERGAASDTDGQYAILNLAPGSYTVVASMVGYARIRVEGVSVSIDRTTRVDFEMRQETVQGEEILVIAERPLLEKDRTTSISYVGADDIANLPVQEVSDLLQLQSDVSYDAQGRLHMRGGRSGEVAFLIDGIPVTNQLSGGSKIRDRKQLDPRTAGNQWRVQCRVRSGPIWDC